MSESIHPLLGLRITCGDLELAVPSDDEMGELIDVARGGIHAPGVRPFAAPWTEIPEPQFGWQFAAFQWAARASAGPDRWALNLMVRKGGEIVGMQSLRAEKFPGERSVETASWIGQSHQGRGIGTLVRRAALELAFAHLGALNSMSYAFADNGASLAVSAKLGYHGDGESMFWDGHEDARLVHLRLDRDEWLARPDRPQLHVLGLDQVRELLELPQSATR